MKILVSPSELKGSVQVPPSKSAFIRAVAAAALSSGSTKILNPSYSQDGIAALRIAQAMGAHVESEEESCMITGQKNQVSDIWNIGESGLAARLFIPVAALNDSPIQITGGGSILKRPIGVYDQLLPHFGVDLKSNEGFLPYEIKGPLRGGDYEFDAEMSSQHITGLLFALPKCKEDSTLKITNFKSKAYIDMSIELLQSFGIEIDTIEEGHYKIAGNQTYNRNEITIDGDWSAAATLLVAGAIAGRSEYEVAGLDTEFTQADKSILGCLLFSGSKIKNQLGDYQITTNKIKGFNFDATDCPDLFPVLSALAVFADSPSTIKGVHRLIHKESNRGAVIVEELAKAGIEAKIQDDDTLIIHPGQVKKCTMNSHGDHRIAMMAVLIGLGGAMIELEGAEAVEKSYPNFYADLISLGAKIRI